MGPLLNIFYPWGIILQGLAIFHFIRRRPDTYWLWIILFGGGLGAAVYIVAEVLPDTGLLRKSRSEEHTSELQSQSNLVCRLLLEKKKKTIYLSRMYHLVNVEVN